MLRMIAKLTGSTALVLATASTALGQPAAGDSEILRRMQALEERVQQLEARNKELEAAQARVAEAIPTDSKGDPIAPAVMVKSGLVPTIGDAEGKFTFKPRGVIDFDFGFYNERDGGFDYLGGTNVRRARIGLEGTAFSQFAWRVEADFAESGRAELTDAYIQFTSLKDTTITVGQFKVPQGFDGNSSDNYNTFMESSMIGNAFGIVAGRRIGVGIDHKKDNWTAALAFSGDNNSASRLDEATDGSIGLNARGTYMPINTKETQVQVGVAGYYRFNMRTNELSNTYRAGDRPNIRIDNTRIADTGNIRAVDEAHGLNFEAVASTGPFSVQGEFHKVWLDRSDRLLPPGSTGPADDLSFDGFYVMGTWLLTGERRPLKGGVLDRIRPNNNFDPAKGHWGAFELAFKYGKIDLTESPGSRAGNEAQTISTALNWYLTPNIKMLLNWVRFSGTNTPLDPVGDRTAGDAFAGRFHIDF
jgi:phosphate-selective porin OprO/OprP